MRKTLISRATMRALGVLSVLGSTSPVVAADHWHMSTVRSLQVLSNGSGFILTLDSDSSSCASGSTPKQYWMLDGQNGVTTAGVPANYANALSAKLTGRPLSIFFSDATTNCYFSNTRIEP